jgi:hypothetical protein
LGMSEATRAASSSRVQGFQFGILLAYFRLSFRDRPQGETRNP